MLQTIRQWIEANQTDILKANQRLVSLPSENLYPNGEELKVQLEVNKLLQQLGFTTDVFLPTDVQGLTEHEAFLNEGRIYDNRPNVVGVLKGTGGGKSLLFSGHMDTVPRGGDRWTKEPFGGEIEGDKQYGLGILDMKSGMVAAIMAAKCVKELGYTLQGDLLIETVVDEEYGGANGTLASRLRGYNADAAIVPEPTNLAICPAAQGGSYFRVTFEGRAGRSYSGENTINPIYPAARFVEIIRQYHEWRNLHTPVHPLYVNNPELATLIQVMRAGDVDIDLGDRVPSSCSFDVWIQCYPDVTEEQLYQEFISFYQNQAADDELLCSHPPKIEKKLRFLYGTSMSEDHPLLDTLKTISTQAVGASLPYQGAPFACDSFIFNKFSSTPAVLFGPSGKNAHAVDEHICISDFLKLVEIYAATIIEWCGGVKK
ncbi:M20/M25/M40 family metallo-hydrolase [Paenibacillus sp. J2TS4]|uniref:M20/M25/M40 family metallo-hydrolase n=1 Tax=Paenibacillus sp. J2TS4 TaxID=2807194 RepID=UPI001B0BC467|nr:M20/M25/M40 family metallo-hydrolase [Paenibacillus sp. J2TS4]GIP33558.1 acetylornithine deacetylase [Paenibacillus sp. J2TS4]